MSETVAVPEVPEVGRGGRGPGLLARARASLAAFENVARNPDLRNIQLALVGSVTGSWAYGVAIAVYAYKIDGAAGVGLVGLIRTLPSALAGPFVAALGDRYQRLRVMVISDLARAALFVVAAAIVMTGGPSLVVYVIGGAIMLAGTAFRPAQSALLPKLTRTPEELTASNVVATTVESVGFFAGPALGGILLAVSSVETVFIVSAVTCVWSAVLVARVRGGREKPSRPAAGGESFFSHALGGFRAARDDGNVFLLLFLFTVQTLIAGALVVLIVVFALEMVFNGEAGVGYFNAVTGIGGVLGAGVAAAFVRSRNLTGGFVAGNMLWGLPLIVIGLAPESIVGYLMFAAIGLGNTVVDVAGITLLQRAVPDEVMSRVFGVLETVLMASVGLGALLTPVVIDALGREGGFIAIGALLPAVTLLTYGRLRKIDSGEEPPAEPLALLQALPIFQPLAIVTQERLAGRMTERHVAPGEPVVRQDEHGEEFFVIAEGAFHALVDGAKTNEMGPGDPFGEIALLRNVPRTATVTAPEGGRVYVLERADFLSAVNGTVGGATAADELATSRLRIASPMRRLV